VLLAFNIDYIIEAGVLFKVTDSHVHCKYGEISETVQDRDVITTEQQ